MKQLALTLFTAFLCCSSYAQDNTLTPGQMDAPKVKRPKVRLDRGPGIYISTSTGLNNNTGIIGFNFELPLSPHVTIDAGPGTCTWNHRLYVGAKYYLKPAQRGFALGAGIAYSNGTRGHYYSVTTLSGYRTEAKFNKNPQTNAMFAAYKYWNLGRQYNRFYVELGWSLPLSSGDKITQVSGPAVTEDSKYDIINRAPGGPILATGVSFGLH